MDQPPRQSPTTPPEPAADQPTARAVPVAIQPPRAPGRSVGEFVFQLVTITAGVLIALLLDSLVEWNHYRLLVREARATMAREIADNKADVEATLSGVERENQLFENALRLVDDLLTAKQSDIHSIGLEFQVADLSAASWEGAERTGALGHMDYAEVQQYSKLYALQDLYAERQRRSLELLGSATAILLGGDPHRAPANELEAFRQQVRALRAHLELDRQLGRRLIEAYGRALE